MVIPFTLKLCQYGESTFRGSAAQWPLVSRPIEIDPWGPNLMVSSDLVRPGAVWCQEPGQSVCPSGLVGQLQGHGRAWGRGSISRPWDHTMPCLAMQGLVCPLLASLSGRAHQGTQGHLEKSPG